MSGHVHRKGRCGRLCGWCLLPTMSYPVEHALWSRIPSLRELAHLLSGGAV